MIKKVYILISECMDHFYGDSGEIYENEDEAREALKHEYKFKRFAELYECELIDNTGFKRSLF